MSVVDDHFCAAIADRVEQAGKNVIRVSVKHPVADGVCLEHDTIVRVDGGARSRIASIDDIGSLRGLHNAQNAACASAAAIALGVDKGVLQQGLRSFPASRIAWSRSAAMGRVLFINDSKGTNADAAARALSSFKDIFWIAGGKPKTGGIESLREFFPRIRKAYLIGEAAQEFAATLGDVPHEISKTLEEAVPHAARDAEASGIVEPVVLLSPACASFRPVPEFRETRRPLSRTRHRAARWFDGSVVLFLSWPGLSRPSTSSSQHYRQDVDARHKAGHDGSKDRGMQSIHFDEIFSRICPSLTLRKP